jgi:aminoglycoside phosphotransferase (APT) family kinase protein
MSDDVLASKLGSASSRDGLSRLGQHLGVDAPHVVGRLRGGAACDVFWLELDRGGGTESVVLKTFPVHMAVSAGFEWAALKAAVLAPIPTPEPLAFDQSGAWFGTPSIVMSRLPGSPVWEPADVAGWTRQLASTLAGLHAAGARRLPESMGRPAIWDRWTPTELPMPVLEGVRSALARLAGSGWERGLCHGDFHPGNVLFGQFAVTGVVDWVSARWGPVLSDLARCRCALAIWPGGDAPGQLLEHYVALTNRSLAGLDYWDVLSGALTVERAGGWVATYRDLDVAVDETLMRNRADAFMHEALRRAGLL